MAPQNLDELGEKIAADAAHIDAAFHRILTMIRVFDDAAGWRQQGFRSCASWLSWRVHWTPPTARERVRVAKALGGLPQIDEALRLGKLSYAKVRAITRVATSDNELVLLGQALLMTGHQLDQLCRKYASVRAHEGVGNDLRPGDDLDRRYVRRRDTGDGMVVIEARLHPEESAVVWAALERVAAERCRARPAATASAEAYEPGDRSASVEAHAAGPVPRNGTASAEPDETGDRGASAEAHETGLGRGDVEAAAASTASAPADACDTPAFDRADALVTMAEAVLRGDQVQRSPTELLVSVPIEALRAQCSASDVANVGGCRDGTALSPAIMRRLACDAGLVAVVEDEHGNTLAVGRKQRTISGALKRALLRRDETCRFPGCTTRVFLEGHHMQHWADGGETKLSNVVGLCSMHHRFVHEYGFMIELGEDGAVTAYRPDGRAVHAVPAAMQLAGLGWPTIEQRNERLAITADTIGTWDGTPADYVELVDALVRADAHACSPASA